MPDQPTDARQRFLDLLQETVRGGSLVKLTLGKYRGPDETVRNLFVRPVQLKAGPHLTFVWRHATRDITKNLAPDAALDALTALIGQEFRDAHLFTTQQTAQFETNDQGRGRLSIKAVANPAGTPEAPPTAAPAHDAPKAHAIDARAPWLRALGVTNDRGQPREGMSAKLRQINRFVEVLEHLVSETTLPNSAGRPLNVADMGCGKGYLTFATAAYFGERARVVGIEVRPALVAQIEAIARAHDLPTLSFRAGDIASTDTGPLDVLIALHACDTATDDALAVGHAAGAALLVVSPCCQKELRPQLTAPDVLADALRHGIFQERHAEFVTDALRAQLLEWAGYRTKVFEFISTEHTARNVMIAASRAPVPPTPEVREALATRIRAFATFYGIRRHHLAERLGFSLRS